MAKLRIFQSIENTDYIFLFNVDPATVSSNDKELMAKFGEPEINFGGTFTSGPLEIILPDEYRKVLSGLPFKKIVTPSAEPWVDDTDDKLVLYRTEMITRFTNAMTALRSQGDTFTGEYVNSI